MMNLEGGGAARILSNVRCLSEGVDVPALDAVIFMEPRSSQIDVIQAVGRVMRKSEGKELGYIIIPVGIPPNSSSEKALEKNERYKVIWQVLNALRAHDKRMDKTLIEMKLGADVSDRVEVVVVEEIPKIKEKNLGESEPRINRGLDDNDTKTPRAEDDQQNLPGIVIDEVTKAIYAQIVKNCGTRNYWIGLTRDIERLVQTFDTHIRSAIREKGDNASNAFLAFLDDMRHNLNPEISKDAAVEMLAQHMAIIPVFDAMFENYEFTSNNPVSISMEKVLSELNRKNIQSEAEYMEDFFDNIRQRVKGIDDPAVRQALLKEIYEMLFKEAFPKMADQLGIVYTPNEVVDFILYSVNEVLSREFGQTLGSRGVNIVDPFTGTGTFVTQLIQSGLIKRDELEYKYKNEIFANEIVPLAYYVAAISIEEAYHKEMNDGGPYTPFSGITLTDTFQIYEKQNDLLSKFFVANSDRRDAQRSLDIRVIIGNPPYSVGQKDANNLAANVKYSNLDERINQTYVSRSLNGLGNKRNLYDSYIRAFRWATDRIKESSVDGSGVVAFVTGGAWVDRIFADGMRKCLECEFSDLYIFYLRGNIRKSRNSQFSENEGENIFGQGSQMGIAISVLVCNPNAEKWGNIWLHDIGCHEDVRTTDQKRKLLRKLQSLSGISKIDGWERVIPDNRYDWIDKIDQSFTKYTILGNKSRAVKTVFKDYSHGTASNRDAWAYNFDIDTLKENMKSTIEVYNNELSRGVTISKACHDPKRIKWTRGLKEKFRSRISASFSDRYIRTSMYRPFQKVHSYLDPMFIEGMSQAKKIFPDSGEENLVISVTGPGAESDFSVLMTDHMPDLMMIDKGCCFPLNLYEEENGMLNRVSGISDSIFDIFCDRYPTENILKEDLFFYIYGILHHTEYRDRYRNNLAKELPRIPPVRFSSSFWSLSKAGRELGDLHVNYERVEPYEVNYVNGDPKDSHLDSTDPDEIYRVDEKGMRFVGADLTKVAYNDYITMSDIPISAYNYCLRGRPVLKWIMNRWKVKVDDGKNGSHIVNDSNQYAIKTAKNPRYPLNLFLRMITVCLRTQDIISKMPNLDLMDAGIE